MKYLKIFEDFEDDKTNWVEVIEFMRNEFYDKIEFVKSKMLEFEDRIDGVFNKQQYRIKENTPCLSELQLGFASESSYESFFMKECSLIVNRCQNQEEIIKTIKSCCGIERFKEKFEIIKNRKRRHSDTIYYPYYKFEGNFHVEKYIEKENTEERYVRWCNRILSDIFPGWKSYVQIRIIGENAQFWVHLVDKTNLPKNISESLKYHLDNNKPITENIFRPGSEAFFKVIKEARDLYESNIIDLCEVDKELYESTDIGKFEIFNGELVPLDIPMEYIEDINEAEYKGKEVKLNHPMRGGSKKYYVYVKNPKTGKVKKISFGDVHGGLTAKVSNPKARKSFAARHQCNLKKDKTKAGYWACRINKYGHLWGGKTYPGYW